MKNIMTDESFSETLEIIRKAIWDTLTETTKGDVNVGLKTENLNFQFSIEINGFRRLSPSYSVLDMKDEGTLLRMFLMSTGLVYTSYLMEVCNKDAEIVSLRKLLGISERLVEIEERQDVG